VLGFNLVVLGVYKVEETTKEEFVANVVQIEMQHRHFYTSRHATRATNAVAAYRIKCEIIDINMVYGFHFI
jgi:hypothetical protein